MDTRLQAVEFVKEKRLPYWKLYKGKDRVSDFSDDENPSADADHAIISFEKEIATRSSGQYYVVAFRKASGSQGGQRFDFEIQHNSPANMYNQQAPISLEQIREQVKNELEIKASLSRIEDKVNALGEFLISQYNDDEKDDLSGLKRITEVFSLFKGLKPNAAVPFEAPIKPLSPAVSKGYFD